MTKLWGGRFEQDITDAVLDYTHTVNIDLRLIKSDLWQNIVHVLMLSHQNILRQEDGRRIVACLLQLLRDADQIVLDKQLEDVHLNLEHRVIRELGIDVGGQMHTARSRNDQVVTDTRMYLREQVLEIEQLLLNFAADLVNMAEGGLERVMVGYTHSQSAQPISLGYWLTSYASMFLRDARRLSRVYEDINQNPLGTCALAGTSFPIDREITTALLGFDGLLLHGLDATSSRDFIIDTVSVLAIVAGHLSKLAEEIVVWSSFEFRLIEVHDSFATGSSIMPQKKNPVVAELARARAGRVYGALMHLLTMVKGVSMGYSCDLQEDKPPLWAALDDVSATVSIMHAQMQALSYDSDRARELCWINFSTATDLANYLVAHKQIAFRESHRIVGQIVNRLSKDQQTLAAIDIVVDELRAMNIDIAPDELRTILDPVHVVLSYTSAGGTSPTSVRAIIATLRQTIDHESTTIQQRQRGINTAFQTTHTIAQQFIEGANIRDIVAH